MRKGYSNIVERGRILEGKYASSPGDRNGKFIFTLSWRHTGRRPSTVQVIAGVGMGWEHVSVTIIGHNRCPTWEEMCAVKGEFFDAEECVIQFHPPRSKHVNTHRYCLHLWRPTEYELPMPHPVMV